MLNVGLPPCHAICVWGWRTLEACAMWCDTSVILLPLSFEPLQKGPGSKAYARREKNSSLLPGPTHLIDLYPCDGAAASGWYWFWGP